MKFWVGVTDNDWFNFLSHAGVDELNFWHPGGKPPFVGLETGSLFLFKLKRPFNHIAGGGIFVKFTKLPLSMAWDAFGVKNGAPNQSKFEAMIRGLRSNPNERDPEIGCTILSSPFFLPRESWIDPLGWSSSIVQGKHYETDSAVGRALWDRLQERLQYVVPSNTLDQVQEPLARYGTPSLVTPRLGQGGFKVVVTDAYKRRCAITGECTLPVLEAAHILPFAQNGPNDVSNGLLLRSDFHKLFDSGLVTVTPDLHIKVSPRIREEWFNGQNYYRLHGRELAVVPDNMNYRPRSDLLAWHNEKVFIGS